MDGKPYFSADNLDDTLLKQSTQKGTKKYDKVLDTRDDQKAVFNEVRLIVQRCVEESKNACSLLHN